MEKNYNQVTTERVIDYPNSLQHSAMKKLTTAKQLIEGAKMQQT